MIVWGGATAHGFANDGAAYNPLTDRWRSLPTSGAPSPRSDASAVWTGTEMIVWGGTGPQGPLNDGAAYDPSTNNWRPLPQTEAPAGGANPLAVWTGSDMIIWGASGEAVGGRFNFDTNTWSAINRRGPLSLDGATVWTGHEMIVWGGDYGRISAYDPASDTWQRLETAGAPGPRQSAAVVWTGTEMIVWGGGANPLPRPQRILSDGDAYNPVTNSWRSLSTDGAPSPRYDASAVWTGTEMIVWGGTGPQGPLNDGAAYNPSTNTWRSIPPAPVPGRCYQSGAWTGMSLLIWGGSGICDDFGIRPLGDGAELTLGALHDARFFPQTGFRIDNDTIWDYFNRRGGLGTFGYPISRTFVFQGFLTQFFQRRVVQIGPDGQARLLNLLGPGLLPYSHFNGAAFPESDPALVAAAPTPTDARATLAFVAAHAPDTFQGMPVHFGQTFAQTVPASVAFPDGGGDPSVLPGFDLEMWGIPTSQPMVDPNNHTFVYLRWQRGIMMYDARCDCTQGILLGDYLKDMLTGQNLPADLAAEAQNSPLLAQYAPGQPDWVRDPQALPDTNLTNAFVPE